MASPYPHTSRDDRHFSDTSRIPTAISKALNAGDREQALAVLEAKVANHESDVFAMATHPAYFGLHQDPKFQALVARIGIASATPPPKT